MESKLLLISNRGQLVADTNYWDSEHAKNGFFYLSWNAGAGRLLVPDSQKAAIREMRTAKEHVVISSGLWMEPDKNIGRAMLELLFDDNSDAPYSLFLSAVQTDRTLPDSDQGSEFFL